MNFFSNKGLNFKLLLSIIIITSSIFTLLIIRSTSSEKENLKNSMEKRGSLMASITMQAVKRPMSQGENDIVATTLKDIKKGSKAWKRRKSYCARSAGQLRNSSPETRNNPNSRINQARRRWRC